MPGESHLIEGKWEEGAGTPFSSTNPATGETVWHGVSADGGQIERAVQSARKASPGWVLATEDQRIAVLLSFAEQLKRRKSELSLAISQEIGKPRWESATEVDAMIGKIPLSIDAYNVRCRSIQANAPAGVLAVTRYKPHGVIAVFGPFNFPGHLPNGHIAPALLAGNTVVFKPSELSPLVGQIMARCWLEAGLPAGVLNLLQGARETGQALAGHPGIDGIFFTGSATVGRALSRSFADRPDKILALEMGGNNPLIVHDVSNMVAAALITVQSAFVTAGQRCTCARRLIVPRGDAGDAFIAELESLIPRIRVGAFTTEPEPFMGPVVSARAAEIILKSQEDLIARGGVACVRLQRLDESPAMLSPGLIDVTAVKDRPDVEIFGPLLQLIRVADFDSAIAEANHTAFGLAAGLLTDDRALFDHFFARIRAGVVNWNRPLTGASGALPFGGVGLSGNHRPSGYFAADYCSYPVASMEDAHLVPPAQLPIGIAPEPVR